MPTRPSRPRANETVVVDPAVWSFLIRCGVAAEIWQAVFLSASYAANVYQCFALTGLNVQIFTTNEQVSLYDLAVWGETGIEFIELNRRRFNGDVPKICMIVFIGISCYGSMPIRILQFVASPE